MRMCTLLPLRLTTVFKLLNTPLSEPHLVVFASLCPATLELHVLPAVGVSSEQQAVQCMVHPLPSQSRLDRMFCRLHDWEPLAVEMVGQEPIPGLTRVVSGIEALTVDGGAGAFDGEAGGNGWLTLVVSWCGTWGGMGR